VEVVEIEPLRSGADYSHFVLRRLPAYILTSHVLVTQWDGFVVEPVLMWPILLPEENGAAPRIDGQWPIVNTKFLRHMAMGDGMQLAEEAARLSEELGLGVRAEELPELDELVERLRSLIDDPEKCLEMQRQNAAYYQAYLRPDKLIERTLLDALSIA
jgi:hypothetical protein